MGKRLAMTTDGKLTYCLSSDVNIGKGRCNHVIHIKNGESKEDFIDTVEILNDVLKRETYRYSDSEFCFPKEDGKYLDHDSYSADYNFFKKEAKNLNINILAKSANPLARVVAIENGYSPKKLENDPDFEVRIALVHKEYKLDKYINDKDPRVRAEVAKQGYGLEKLIKDKEKSVRLEVAKQCYDSGVYSCSDFIKEEIINQGLDKLVDEEKDFKLEFYKQKEEFVRGLMYGKTISNDNRW